MEDDEEGHAYGEEMEEEMEMGIRDDGMEEPMDQMM